MYNVKQMIGKPVVSVTTGERYGAVSDALVETAAARVLGLVVSNGIVPKEHVLPLTDVQTVGPHAVLVRGGEHLLTAREWRRSETEATRSSAISGRRVITEQGEQLGHVKDLLVDEHTGALGGVEVEERTYGGLVHRRSVIAAPPAPKIGPDAVVVGSPPYDSAA